MKRLMVGLGLCMVATLCLPLAAHAQQHDQLSEVVTGLKDSAVYIAPGTENTDVNTAAGLLGQLSSNDNVALIMLPDSTPPADQGNVSAFAQQVSAKIGAERIIGITQGSVAVGYAPNMPEGVAADLMHRAVSVSTNNVETLGTFARNVHQWQSDHPHAKTTAPKHSKKDSSSPYWVIVIIGVCGCVLALSLTKMFERRTTPKQRTHFKGPGAISDLLSDVARLRTQVDDPDFQQVLSQICLDLEKYFQRYSKDRDRDTQAFTAHLTSILDVLKRYVEVQDNTRYYNDPDQILQQGRDSIRDFGDFVISSIRSGNEAALMNYNVDTRILGAKKYSV